MLAIFLRPLALLLAFSAFAPSLCMAGNQTGAAFAQKGQASWISKNFKGERTASGERYDPAALTAAHNSLPLGTLVLVTNLKNNKNVTVCVNDRGPYSSERIIDLSWAAAERLGIVKGEGEDQEFLTPVMLQTVGKIDLQTPAPAAQQGDQSAAAPVQPEAVNKTDADSAKAPDQAQPPAPASRLVRRAYYIQAGAFQRDNNAAALVKTFQIKGFSNFLIVDDIQKDRDRLRLVQVGPFHDLQQARSALKKIQDEEPGAFIISKETRRLP
ncbi:MAG: rare lipoprotein [Desulfovibrionales bacterium]|nr:rare lipoprotein [Desulfovibrionales bacterium]